MPLSAVTFVAIDMESFQAAKNFFNMMGIYSPQQNPNSSFNFKIFIVLLLMAVSFIQSFGILLFQAKSTFEYGISFYASVTTLAVIAIYSLIIWHRVIFFTVTEKFEAFIAKSKGNSKI